MSSCWFVSRRGCSWARGSGFRGTGTFNGLFALVRADKQGRRSGNRGEQRSLKNKIKQSLSKACKQDEKKIYLASSGCFLLRFLHYNPRFTRVSRPVEFYSGLQTTSFTILWFVFPKLDGTQQSRIENRIDILLTISVHRSAILARVDDDRRADCAKDLRVGIMHVNV